MPAYEEALAADPAAFVDCASEMSAAGTDLGDHRSEYDAKVAEINGGWQDAANTAFNDDVAIVDEHVEQVVSQVGEAVEVLRTGGSAMVSQVEQLQAVDAAYKGAGFIVRPAPKVELGPAHWAAIAAAGPFGPVLQAMFQARADEGTMRLTTGLAVLTATDAATGAALTAAAEALEPLEDKGPGATDCLPVAPEEIDGNLEKQEQSTERKQGRDTGKTTDEDEDKGKDKKDKKNEGGEDEDKKDDDDQGKDEQENDQRPEDPRADAEQPPDQPPGNEIPGYEPSDAVQPEVPDFTTDPIDAATPDYGDPWKPTELEDTELPSGGLASGGGGGGLGGGGLGSPDVSTGGPGMGTGMVTTAAGGGTPAGTPTGGRPGIGGGLMGAPGARGVADPDEEFERESFLTEDPEEDVWGIGTDEGNPYVDYLEEQPKQPDLPPLPPIDGQPPISLPGFDLPEPKP